MIEANKALARAFFNAVTKGELPEAMVTDDMSAWTTMGGTTTKAHYQQMIRKLRVMCKEPIRFTLNSLTAEGDRVAVEATSEATLINGVPYSNTYFFLLRVRNGHLYHVSEHFNALIVSEKLIPLMKTLDA